MLTAKQVRQLTPDKDKTVQENVEHLCNAIQNLAKGGNTSLAVGKYDFVYQKETLAKMRKLGYKINRSRAGYDFIEW